MKNKSKFIVKNKFKLDDLKDGDEVPLADLTLQGENENFVQFELKNEDEEYSIKKIKIKPGIYTMVATVSGIKVLKTDLSLPKLLHTVDNTARIKKEIETFFSKLHIYDELELPKKRALLLYGPPGTSKTTSINQSILDLNKKKKDSVTFIWPTSNVEAHDIKKFLSFGIDYDKSIKKQILVIEDIGGVSSEGSMAPRRTDPELLNLLDGIGLTFHVPTMIMATTNYPENLLENLADRPGRFDEMVEMLSPSKKQKLELLTFLAKRELTQEERNIFNNKNTDDFSISHLKEIVIRSRLHDKTFIEIIKDMTDHKERFKSGFEKNKKQFGID